MKLKFLVFFGLMFLLGGCPIMTRSQMNEVEEKKVMQEQVTTLQKENTDATTRYADIQEDLRSLNGRVELLERKSEQEAEKNSRNSQEVTPEQSRKIQALQEEVTHLNEQLAALSAEVAAMKSSSASVAGKKESSNSFETAENYFEAKEWKQAILSYQKFREKNPNSKKVPEAIYKIGVSFQELGMKEEAKTFYDEVVDKFADSKEAKKAKIRLKSLKK